MTDITTSRNINAIVPVSHFGGIRPICVPIELDSSFSDEVSGRFSKRVNSLWDRLGLVFFTEEQQAPVRDEKQIVVNNFSSQIIFQLFSNKNTRRLVEKDQPGFVYLDNICKQYESRQNQLSERISREIAEKISYTDRLAQQVKYLYEALGDGENTERSAQLLTVTLEKLLREKHSRNQITNVEEILCKRLQKVLVESDKVVEKEIAERLFEEVSRQDDTVDSRNKILSIISDYNTDTRANALRKEAAELFINAVGGEESSDEIRKSLVLTIDRLHNMVYEDVGKSSALNIRTDASEHTVDHNAERAALNGTVSPVFQQYDITRSVTELLHIAADEAGADASLTVAERIISSFSGKSVETIEKHIRRVYGNIATNGTAYASQVISAASGVVLSLLTKSEPTLTTKGDNSSVAGAAALSVPSYVGANAAVANTVAHSTALSAYFNDLYTGAEPFFDINSDATQAVSYKDIKRAVSNLMTSRTSCNMMTALNRVPITRKIMASSSITINNENNHSDIANNAFSEINHISHFSDMSDRRNFNQQSNVHAITQILPQGETLVNGTFLPTQQNSYTVNKSGDVYYTENRQSGDVNNISNTMVTNTAVSDRSVHQGDNVSNVMVNGTVLPAQQNSYTMNKSGDVYYAEDRQSSEVNNINNTTVMNTAKMNGSVYQGDNVSNVTLNGTVLPTQQNSYAVNKSGDVYYAEDRQSGDANNVSNTMVTNTAVSDRSVYQGDNVSNVTLNGTVLPTQQNSYAVNKSGDVYYAEDRQSGDVNNINNTTVMNTAKMNGSVYQGDNISNVTVNGTVLPTQQNSYAVNKSGDVYYTENRQSGDVNNINNTTVMNTAKMNGSVYQGDNVSNVTVNGTVLPTQQNSYTVNKSGDVYYAEDRQLQTANNSFMPAQTGSYRSKLDSKTLAALNEMIQSAGIKTNARSVAEDISEKYAVKEAHSDVVYEYVQQARDVRAEYKAEGVVSGNRRKTQGHLSGLKEPDRIQINQLRTAAVMRRGIGITITNSSAHISGMIEHLSNDVDQVAKGRAVNSGFSYRTIDSGENMVMLIPPTEMDRYQAENGYTKQMPPIELKQKAEMEQPKSQPQKKQKAVNVKNEPVNVKTMGSIEGMSREEISKLVDKVYEQLEVRLLRERRRHGL